MPGFFEDKAYEVMKRMMEEEGIEPGELNERFGETLEMINKMAPVIRAMEDTSQEFTDNVNDLSGQLEQFNENADDLATSMENLGESLDKLNGMMEKMDETDEW